MLDVEYQFFSSSDLKPEHIIDPQTATIDTSHHDAALNADVLVDYKSLCARHVEDTKLALMAYQSPRSGGFGAPKRLIKLMNEYGSALALEAFLAPYPSDTINKDAVQRAMASQNATLEHKECDRVIEQRLRWSRRYALSQMLGLIEHGTNEELKQDVDVLFARSELKKIGVTAMTGGAAVIGMHKNQDWLKQYVQDDPDMVTFMGAAGVTASTWDTLSKQLPVDITVDFSPNNNQAMTALCSKVLAESPYLNALPKTTQVALHRGHEQHHAR